MFSGMRIYVFLYIKGAMNLGEYQHLVHKYPPVFDSQSKVLILGTFPSVKSRELGFYYGHPQNRFWKVLAHLTDEPIPQTIDEKKMLLLKHHIALGDVIKSCDIIGSSDSSIKNVVPSDISAIFSNSQIECIYANGKTAARLYQKYLQPVVKKEMITLPSTSPANAMYSLEKLIDVWKQIKDFL